MTTRNQTPKMHPLIAVAAIAVIIACLVGIAAAIGILPNFNKPTPPVVATETIGANAPASAVATAPAPAPAAVEPPAPAPKAAPKKPARKPVHTAATSTRDTYSDDQYRPASRSCSNCGVVESVRAVEQEGSSSGIGAGVGAVVGGLLGNQVGGGNGRTLATIAGAVGGGYAGNEIEKRRSATTTYEVIVRMDSGGTQRFMMREQRWRSGDLVRVVNGSLISR